MDKVKHEEIHTHTHTHTHTPNSKTGRSQDNFTCEQSPLPLQKHKALTREVVLKAGLCRNHPFGPGLTENGNSTLRF